MGEEMTKPQFESVSNFRNHYSTILQKLAEGPLYLIQYSSPAAVLIDPKQWNAILERLALIDNLEDQVSIYRHKWLVASGQVSHDYVTPEELASWMTADEKIPA